MEKGWAELDRRVAEAVAASPKWRKGVADTAANRRAWRVFVMRIFWKVPRRFWWNLSEGMKKRVRMCRDAKGERIPG